MHGVWIQVHRAQFLGGTQWATPRQPHEAIGSLKHPVSRQLPNGVRHLPPQTSRTWQSRLSSIVSIPRSHEQVPAWPFRQAIGEKMLVPIWPLGQANGDAWHQAGPCPRSSSTTARRAGSRPGTARSSHWFSIGFAQASAQRASDHGEPFWPPFHSSRRRPWWVHRLGRPTRRRKARRWTH